jgi:signal transduction histidine kinase
LRLRCVHKPSVVCIQVLDTGIGITKQHLPFIFDEFYQVGAESSSVREGYGLGLGIVQRLASLLHLGIEVESDPGKGSIFPLDLPASDAVAAAAAARTSGGGRHPRLLIVEDDPR